MIYTMGFFHSFMVVIPVFVPLLQGYGLSMTQVLQTQAMFALTVAVLEVPSGYFADLCGRRLADDVDLRPVHPFYRIRFDDGDVFDYSGDPEAMRQEIRRFSPEDEAG